MTIFLMSSPLSSHLLQYYIAIMQHYNRFGIKIINDTILVQRNEEKEEKIMCLLRQCVCCLLCTLSVRWNLSCNALNLLGQRQHNTPVQQTVQGFFLFIKSSDIGSGCFFICSVCLPHRFDRWVPTLAVVWLCRLQHKISTQPIWKHQFYFIYSVCNCRFVWFFSFRSYCSRWFAVRHSSSFRPFLANFLSSPFFFFGL